MGRHRRGDGACLRAESKGRNIKRCPVVGKKHQRLEGKGKKLERWGHLSSEGEENRLTLLEVFSPPTRKKDLM